MRYILLACILAAAPFLRASDALKMPEIKTAQLKEKLHVLLEAEVFHIQEEKGSPVKVVVKAQGVFKKVELKARPGDAGFVSAWEKFSSREYVLVEGVDSGKLATGEVLFHKQIGVGQRGLWVWECGVEKIRMKYIRKGKPMWLKKYTVLPENAEKFLKKGR